MERRKNDKAFVTNLKPISYKETQRNLAGRFVPMALLVRVWSGQGKSYTGKLVFHSEPTDKFRDTSKFSKTLLRIFPSISITVGRPR